MSTYSRGSASVGGTDATGIAYHFGGRLRIYKRPLAAHRLRLRVPNDVQVIMWHTHMATQGSAKKNCNNHPFAGEIHGKPFALANNGVLWNDRELQLTENLPATFRCWNKKTPSTFKA